MMAAIASKPVLRSSTHFQPLKQGPTSLQTSFNDLHHALAALQITTKLKPLTCHQSANFESRLS